MSSRQRICAGLVGMLICLCLRTVAAGEAAKKSLPAAVERVLAWLPDDTETIAASQNFVLWPKDAEFVVNFSSSLCQLPFMELVLFDELKFHAIKRAQKKVVLALRAGRIFEDATMGGVVRSNGCAVIVFEKELGDVADEWTRGLREGSKEVRESAGHEIFVVGPDELEAYLAVLDPKTILCAFSYQYLCELLDRTRVPSLKRALPDSLPVWKHIDPAAPYWMLRQIPKAQKDRLIESVACSINSAKVQITYLPRADSGDRVEKRIRDYTDIGPKHKLNVQIDRSRDGAVSLSTSARTIDEANRSFYGELLYHLQAEDGSVQMSPWGDLRVFRAAD